jgi:hypothetical protein
MQTALLTELRSRKGEIRTRWAELLHVEPVSSPLANPDALIHLINWTLQDFFNVLGQLASRHRVIVADLADFKSLCPCGRNPLLAYFVAGQQAVREALVLSQVSTVDLDPLERDVSLHELDRAFNEVAHREIGSFCGICQHRTAKMEPQHLLAHTHSHA